MGDAQFADVERFCRELSDLEQQLAAIAAVLNLIERDKRRLFERRGLETERS